MSRSEQERVQKDDVEWMRDQLDTLAIQVEHHGLVLSPAQLARLLRDLARGREWVSGGWK